MLKIKHVPEQLFDVTAFPIMFTLMFTYLFGGALAGSTERYLQFLLPGILVMAVADDHDVHRVGAQHRHHEGRLRPVPLAADLAAGAASSARCSATSSATRSPSTWSSRWAWCSGFRPHGGVVGVLRAVALLLVFAFACHGSGPRSA